MEVKPDMKKISNCGKRKGIKDIWWNAFFVKTCVKWALGDIPECPTELIEIPDDLLIWPEAVKLYNKLTTLDNNGNVLMYNADDIINERPEQVFLDIAQRSAAESNGGGHIGKAAVHQHHVRRVDGNIGTVSQKLYDTLTGIQYGRIEDTFGWTTKI